MILCFYASFDVNHRFGLSLGLHFLLIAKFSPLFCVCQKTEYTLLHTKTCPNVLYGICPSNCKWVGKSSIFFFPSGFSITALTVKGYCRIKQGKCRLLLSMHSDFTDPENSEMGKTYKIFQSPIADKHSWVWKALFILFIWFFPSC